MIKPFMERLRERYQSLKKLKGYVWDDGYKAPELAPDISSDQVKALAHMVAELEDRVASLEEEVRSNRVH